MLKAPGITPADFDEHRQPGDAGADALGLRLLQGSAFEMTMCREERVRRPHMKILP